MRYEKITSRFEEIYLFKSLGFDTQSQVISGKTVRRLFDVCGVIEEFTTNHLQYVYYLNNDHFFAYF